MEIITIDDFTSETIKNISKMNGDIILIIAPKYPNILKNFIDFSCISNLAGLILGDYVYKNISFEPLYHITTLKEFSFENGFQNRSQYEFINKQNILEKFEVKTIDLSFIDKNSSLNNLFVHSKIKNENLLSDLFPNLIKFTLHAESTRIEFDFIKGLEKIEEISINYNSHLITLPTMKNPDKIKSIKMLNCYNFVDIESILIYKNLEVFCLTSHDKKLQLDAKDFEKLTSLKKLKTVYTVWGKSEPEKIKEIYKETGWINKNGVRPHFV